MLSTSNSQFVWPRPGVIQERLPKWLGQRLHNVGAEDIHYESSFGGPHNEFLHSYFPTKAGIMVKPIPRLRQIATSDDIQAGRGVSLDSNNLPVKTRRDDDIPDFVVCTATGSLTGDQMFLIWELKRDSEEASKTAQQMDRYEEWLRNYQEFTHSVTGATPTLWLGLVQKDMVTIAKFKVTSPSTPTISHTYYGGVLSGPIHEIMEEIRKEYVVL